MSAIRTSTLAAAPARLALRRSAPRRFQSTSSSSSSTSSASSASTSSTTATDAASKARQTAADVTSKATQGLTRVTSAAGPALAGAARGLSSALGRVGGRTGRFINFVERQTPFVVYYSRVGLELGRLVFRNQKMAPPYTAFQNAWVQLQNPAQLLQKTTAFAKSARNLTPTQLAAGGVLAAEILGFFTVGEIVGRFKLVGYHTTAAPAAAH
ncbi:F-type H+-transporting ATPase subunit g [Sporothrix brasiliensis 5110]|uniref:F-type H+-transporting ATPase subunit g n=1 Tax=Sporothrix brasiliensis 5110 TaxID=1398154 RepID=A0A0C2J485_9PEZI|nr:F-type H+-transporting ATPase subunit g [Sporothrix brasiliensis 5110]KIH91912.1 F-type H+-transporting ATPase subunit g [Sporothrix brasiliensis 5110]